jgi:lysine-N-methylase
MHPGRSHPVPHSWKDHPLRQDLAPHATYAYEFHCIGPACEDTCCQGWTVPIDQTSWEKYQNLPESDLRSLIHASILRTEEPAKPERSPVFAIIRMNAENQCPMLSLERLCSIQAELGEHMLSHACHTYPRIVHTLDGVQETALTLSCPEAARLVLLTPNLLAPSAPGLEEPAIPVSENSANPLPPDFQAIRTTILALVRNRAYPLWERLFLLNILCQRLDSIARGDLKESAAEFLAGFRDSVAGGTLRTAMQSLPSDPTAQVDIVLRLAGLMLHKSNVRPRFVECVQAFTTGIGNGPGATLESLTATYNAAHDRYFQPFVERHPYILENYLVNTILRCQFPYGKEGMIPGALPRMSKEFALLTAQFTLIKGLLIGVAGFHREQFSAAHVIHTVQAAAKHFEHHPEFLSSAHNLLVESHMDGARGMAILLRNATTGRASDHSVPTSPSVPTQSPEA